MFPLAERVPLAPLTTLGLGGPARWLAQARTEDELVAALQWAQEREVPVALLGGGSNLVVADEGFPGVVVAVRSRGIVWNEVEGRTRLLVQAGEPWDDLVAATVTAGLGGIEALSGIPGLAGATPIQNVGAYGRELADVLRAVHVFDRHAGERRVLDRASCALGYRDSRFRREPDRFAVLAVELELTRTDRVTPAYPELTRALETSGRPASPAAVRDTVLELRRSKSMVLDSTDPNHRSVGSFFVNPVVDRSVAVAVIARAVGRGLVREPGDVPQFPTETGAIKLSAAWLIEQAGFPRGTRRGSVGTSSRHALALVHHGGGRTTELLALAREIRGAVLATFGIELRPEPVFLGLPPLGDGDPLPGMV